MAVIAANALTTVADVKETLGLSSGDSTKNNLITRMVNNASALIEAYCNRTFGYGTYTEERDGTGTNEIVLDHLPVIALTAVEYRNTNLNQSSFTTDDPSFYYTENSSGIIRRLTGLYYFGEEHRWRVTYTAGYALPAAADFANPVSPKTALPSDLQEATVTLAVFLMSQQTTSGIQLERLGDREVRYFGKLQGGSMIEQAGLDVVLDLYRLQPLDGRF